MGFRKRNAKRSDNRSSAKVIMGKPASQLSKEEKKILSARMAEIRSENGGKNTVQNTIPFLCMYQDGVCQVSENFFSLTVQFYDANYSIAEFDEQNNIFSKYCDVINLFDNTIRFQLTFENQNRSKAKLVKTVQIPEQDDDFNSIRKEYSEMLTDKLLKGSNGQSARKFLTFGIESTSYKAARAKLMSIKNDVIKGFKAFGVEAELLDGRQRLEALYYALNPYRNSPFLFDWGEMLRAGMDTKDFICPPSLKFNKADFEIGNAYGAVWGMNILAGELPDEILKDFLEMQNLFCVNIHVEPLDQIDIDTLSFLESFIINSSIPIIFISHDEQLIEHSANTIIHVEQLIRKTKSKITISRLCYKEYLDSRNLSFLHQTQIAKKERSEYKKKRERLLQLFEKARNNGGWRNSDGTPSSDGHAKRSMQAIKAKEKRMERESEEFTEIPDREDEIITRFDSNISIPKQKIILDYTIDSLSVDDKILAHNIKLKVVGNQHICIIGSNGIGKSTLLKEIWKLLAKRTDIKVGYMPQNYEDVLDFSQTPTEFLESQYDKEEQTRARMFLGNMKFTADEMLHKISELSGGQKAKLIFLNMVLKKCDVLILDEPTRNFSPLSSPVVCKALMNFGGTIISISHDRRYLNDVADIVYVLSPTGLTLL